MVRDRKYVIPFPNGIIPPIEEYTEALQDRMLKFPHSYEPMIMSALKVLARPETYQSDVVSELNFSVQQGFDILASVEGVVSPVALPNWQLSFNGSFEPYKYFVINTVFTPGRRVYVAFADPTELTIPRLRFAGRQTANASIWAGGVIRHLDVETVDAVPHVFTYTYHNCLGVATTVTDSGSSLVWNNVEMKDFLIDWDTPAGIYMEAVIEQDYSCTQV